MLAAAATLWILFAFWLIAPLLALPRVAIRTAVALFVAELLMLLAWSYGSEGCEERACAPLTQAAGIAARTDVPLLTALFLLVAVLHLRRAPDVIR